MITLTSRLGELVRRALRTVDSRLLRNVGSLGSAQLAIRLSRLAATVMLSRALAPKDYGLAAIVLTVYECVGLFSRTGVTAAIVRADAGELEDVAQNAWLITILVCTALTLVQVLAAPAIALWYHDQRLVAPIMLMGLIYLVGPFSTIQFAFLQRAGRIGRIATASGAQVVTDNILTGVFALAGFGMWAIVLPKILVAPIWLFAIRYGDAWRPQAKNRFRLRAGWPAVLRFSKTVLGVELLTTLQGNVDNLIVGGVLGVQALGVYYFAYNAGVGLTLGLIGSLGVAVYPHLCGGLDRAGELRRRYREALKTLACIIVPIIGLQVVFAPIYVPLVFGRKWTVAVPVMMLICLSALMRPFASVCSSLLRAVDRPDLELRWQAVLTAILVAGLFAGTRWGLTGVAAAVFLVQTLTLAAYCWFGPRRYVAAASQVAAPPPTLAPLSRAA